MVTPPKNKAAKFAMAAMCVSISCTALADQFPDKTGCEIINHSNYKEFMTPKPNVRAENPFKPSSCITIDYSKENVNTLKSEHFGGNKDVMEYFLAQQDRSRMRVEMVMDYESKQLHTFMKFDTNSRDAKGIRDLAKGKDIVAFWDEFIFLHELAHTDPSATLNTSGEMSHREMKADLVALIMLKSSHDMSMEQFFELSETVFDLRKNENLKFQRQVKRSKRRRDQTGNHSHFDHDKFEKIESFLNYLKETKVDLRVDTLNEAQEVASIMMHNFQGTEMISHDSKTFSMDNSPYRQAFFSMEPGEQMVYYEGNKALMAAEILTLFEDYHSLLPAQQEKLEGIAPEIIADASQHFHSEIKAYANEHLASINYGMDDNVELTASITMDPSVTQNIKEEQVTVHASNMKPR